MNVDILRFEYSIWLKGNQANRKLSRLLTNLAVYSLSMWRQSGVLDSLLNGLDHTLTCQVEIKGGRRNFFEAT